MEVDTISLLNLDAHNPFVQLDAGRTRNGSHRRATVTVREIRRIIIGYEPDGFCRLRSAMGKRRVDRNRGQILTGPFRHVNKVRARALKRRAENAGKEIGIS